ncbi:MAG: beta-N-acetylhexosaminidase [Gammaproteobacteria bacterium]|nr:MAG: beta-N-acetylhexosaminidase [Gammaproteobacteria bacterium]
MSLGPLMVDVDGKSLTDEDREILRHPLIGGLILFSRNYESREQLKSLVQEIHALRDPPLIVAVDHEGGSVQRFREEFTHLPAAGQFGQLYQDNPEKALFLTRETGWVLAVELREVDIDISFAPVLDIEQKESRVLRDRTFHSDPQVVSDLAHQIMLGMREAGMQATGKHFPGHGGVIGDSHEELPVDNRRYDEIYEHDILPFEQMIHYGLAGIMPAHVVYRQVDSETAGFSKFWIQDVLRKHLQFTGVVFSDDLSMAGAHNAGSYADRAMAAVTAGCDVLLICNNRDGVVQVLDELEYKPNPVMQTRIARMHGKLKQDAINFQDSPRWQKAVKDIRLLLEEYPVEMELNI